MTSSFFSFFFGAYVVKLTKHNTLLMRAVAIQHPRVCLVSQEVQAHILHFTIDHTADGLFYFFFFFYLKLTKKKTHNNKQTTN